MNKKVPITFENKGWLLRDFSRTSDSTWNCIVSDQCYISVDEIFFHGWEFNRTTLSSWLHQSVCICLKLFLGNILWSSSLFSASRQLKDFAQSRKMLLITEETVRQIEKICDWCMGTDNNVTPHTRSIRGSSVCPITTTFLLMLWASLLCATRCFCISLVRFQKKRIFFRCG